MKESKDILSEAFFKKSSYSDKVANSMPEYQPVKSTGYGSVLNRDNYTVTDTDEVKKRLTKTFGAAFGNNTIKSLASKSIKTFPVIVSDDVTPETTVMLKRLMEEQYAEYINLLISNKIIDLSQYDRNGDTDIALQAVDDISGSDFSSTRLANKARSGEVSTDDVFKNVPLYNLLRQEGAEFSPADDLARALFEGALVIPTEYEDLLTEYLSENMDELAALNEATYVNPIDGLEDRVGVRRSDVQADPVDRKHMSLSQYVADNTDYAKVKNSIGSREDASLALSGITVDPTTNKDVYSKLTNVDIIVDADKLDKAINRSVGEMLADPKNAEIRNRFEKAVFLLNSAKISGGEFIDYCTLRLGIPISKATRTDLVTKFKTSDVRNWNNSNKSIGLIDAQKLRNNINISKPIFRKILSVNYKAIVIGGIVGAGIGSGSAAAIMGLIIGGTIMAGPVVASGAILGGIGALIARMISKHRTNKMTNKIQGWERVEQLINIMIDQQNGVRCIYKNNSDLATMVKPDDSSLATADRQVDKFITDTYKATAPEKKEEDIEALKAELEKNKKLLADLGIHESVNPTYHGEMITDAYISEEYTAYYHNEIMSLCEDIAADTEATAMLEEASMFKRVLGGGKRQDFFTLKARDRKKLAQGITTPITAQKISYSPDEVRMMPGYAAAEDYAYGSVEWDRKNIKDRRYNQPLVITVHFRGRYADDKTADNELTAVIGILGIVSRVPSEEMKYILKSSAEGTTLNGIITNGEDPKAMISNLFSTNKIDKDIKNLPQSADVWNNLSKVSVLAVSNTIAGKKTGNVANAHIVFSQKEIDELHNEDGIDYLKDKKLSAQLMKHYNAVTLMIANDIQERVYIFDDPDTISWNVVPYTALRSSSSSDNLASALTKLGRM